MAERRRYTDAERAQALAALAANGGNVPLTASQLGIPDVTLRNWQRGRRHPEAFQMACEKKVDLADGAEEAARLLLGDLWDEARRRRSSLKDTATAFAILVDKMRLLREQPTSISKSLADLTDDELDRRIRDAEGRTAGHEAGEAPPAGDAAVGVAPLPGAAVLGNGQPGR